MLPASGHVAVMEPSSTASKTTSSLLPTSQSSGSRSPSSTASADFLPFGIFGFGNIVTAVLEWSNEFAADSMIRKVAVMGPDPGSCNILPDPSSRAAIRYLITGRSRTNVLTGRPSRHTPRSGWVVHRDSSEVSISRFVLPLRQSATIG